MIYIKSLYTLNEQKEMILGFGYVCMEMHTVLTEDIQTGNSQKAVKSTLQIGGRAGLQSIAAARAGARVSLISALSNDLMSQSIMKTLRREGIITSAMAQSEKQTAITQIIKSPNSTVTKIKTKGAHEDIKADQIATASLSPRHLVILNDNVPENINLDILIRAKEQGAKSVMSFCAPPDHALFKYLDIAIIQDTTPLPTVRECHIIPAETNGFDCFCGTLAACVQAKYTIEKSIDHAICAQKLYIESNEEGYAALPYLGHMEHIIKKA